MNRRYFAIVNPDAGQDFPIVETLEKFSHEQQIDLHIHATSALTDIPELIQSIPLQTYDALVGYGGDGTITKIATTLIGNQLPLIIIPGGTANVLAKELNLPLETNQALQLLIQEKMETMYIDAYTANKKPGILRINAGILATMITQTPDVLKKNLGQFAYSVTGIKEAVFASKMSLNLIIDDLQIAEDGIGIMIANSGNIGIAGYNLHPETKINDGLLDVIIIKDQKFSTLTEIATMIISQNPSPHIAHYTGKKIHLAFEEPQSIILDDEPHTEQSIDIQITPKAIQVILPTQSHESTV